MISLNAVIGVSAGGTTTLCTANQAAGWMPGLASIGSPLSHAGLSAGSWSSAVWGGALRHAAHPITRQVAKSHAGYRTK